MDNCSARHKETRAQLDELRAREDFAKREMERVTQLLGRGAATVQTHEKIGTDLRQIQALISVQMEKLAYYMITAPMDGSCSDGMAMSSRRATCRPLRRHRPTL
jgi:multidrug resistance efflux pump